MAGVCGVRDLRYDNYLQDPSWRRGFAQLASHKLVLCDDPALDQMADAARLADSCPEVTYCIDHAGFPHTSARRGILRPVARAMTRLAKVQNTIVKVSGLGMSDHQWSVSSMRNWILLAYEESRLWFKLALGSDVSGFPSGAELT